MARSTKPVTRKGANASPTPQPSSEETTIQTLRFDYIKSNYFRVVRVDGVHGGSTPRADGIQMAFFSERKAIPTREEYAIAESGAIGSRTAVEQRDAVIREVEVEAIFSVEVAKKLEEWLHEKIRQVEELRGAIAHNG